MNPEVEKSQDAKEGEAAHWAAAGWLKAIQASWSFDPIGAASPNGIVITEEMAEAAVIFVDTVVELCGSDALDALHIEEWVGPDSERGGTPDTWFASLGPTGGYLTIVDFKYGHRFVDAYENWQCIDYARYILQRPEFAAIMHDRLQIEIVVVQPRNYHPAGPVRRWVTSAAALAPHFNRLATTEAEAALPSARTLPNPECRDCRGRHMCEALQIAADGAMDIAGSTVALELPPAALGVELRMIERAATLLDARRSGLEEQAKGLLRSGAAVPFWQLKQGEGREAWNVPPADVIALGAAYGKDLAKPAAPITPNQARKAGMDAALIDALAARPKGELKLIPVTTKDAKRVFSNG